MDIVLFLAQKRWRMIKKEVNCIYFSLCSARQAQMQPGPKAHHANTYRGHYKNISEVLRWIIYLWIKNESCDFEAQCDIALKKKTLNV